MHAPAAISERWVRYWFAGALLYAAALIVAALTVPVDDGVTSSTVFQANNAFWVSVVVGLPLIGTLAVYGLLRRRSSRRLPGVGSVPWLIIAILGTEVLAGALTVGPWLMPVPLLLGLTAIRYDTLTRPALIEDQLEAKP